MNYPKLLRRHVVREQSEACASQNPSNNTFFIAMDKQEKDDILHIAVLALGWKRQTKNKGS
jgi:hypothetical protein